MSLHISPCLRCLGSNLANTGMHTMSRVFDAATTKDACLTLQVLSKKELDWVNAYHQEVWKKVSPRIQQKDLLAWLEKNTSPL